VLWRRRTHQREKEEKVEEMEKGKEVRAREGRGEEEEEEKGWAGLFSLDRIGFAGGKFFVFFLERRFIET
jgi:hypothetical protein